MSFSGETKEVEVRNTSIDNIMLVLTRHLPLFDASTAIVYATLVIIVTVITVFFRRMSERKQTRNLEIFQDNHKTRNSRVKGVFSTGSSKLKHEKCLSELYTAADLCFIKEYAEKCRSLALYCPYLINVKFRSTGQTAFHRVCFNGEASLIEFMLANGANPRLNSDAGESPICLAIYHYINRNNNRNFEAVSCLDILERAGCSFGDNGIWYDILLKMSIRGGNKTLTEWLLLNGRDMRPYRMKKVARQASEPPLLWFGSWFDMVLTLVGLLAAILSGICIPGIIILYGNLTEAFVQYEIHMAMGNANSTREIPVGFRGRIDSLEIDPSKLAKQTLNFSLSSAALALAQLVFTSMYIICLNQAALNCSNRARELYFKALLHQSISWYDLQNSGDLATSSIRDTNYLEASLGEKLGIFVSSTMAACTCTLVALYYGCKLASELFTVVPIVAVIIYITKRTNDFMKEQESSLYSSAESLVREDLSNVRSIVAYSGQSNECKKYVKLLAPVEEIEVTRGAVNSFAAAILWALIYCMYGFAFWRGVELMRIDPGYTVTTLIVVFFCVQIGVLHILQLPQYIFLINKATSASRKIIDMIGRVPRARISVDLDEQNAKPEMTVVFESVKFAYPSRLENMILADVSFSVPRGRSLGIVGVPNSGKTTILSLIHRFYDPQDGTVRVDGVDVKELNENWLRKYVGYAQQCPVLFGTTIGEGITCHSPYKSPIYLETVSKIVGIHSFIMEFPEKYNCPLTGDLSVEVRQRIALARVLYRKPNILLIDNALSSLSSEAEADVYDSIRSALTNSTVIIVTKNTRILRSVDKICYLENRRLNEFISLNRMIEAHPASRQIMSERIHVIEDMDIETTLKCKHAASTSKIILSSNSSSMEGRSYQELLRSELVRIGRYPVFFQVTDVPTTDNILLGDMVFTRMKKILFYNRKEWLQLLLACIAGAILGFSLPIYTVLFGETLSLVALHNGAELQIRLNFFTNMFLVAGFVSAISTIIQGYMLSVSGSKLTTRMRKRALKRILQRNMEWFDCETNDESGINSLLKTSSPRIQQACGQRIVFMVQAATSLTVSIVLSMSYSWKMGLVTVIFTPLSLLLLRYNSSLQLRRNFFTSVYLNRTKEIIVETVTNAKCIAALTLEEAFLQRYRDELKRFVLENRNVGLHAFVYGSCVALPAIAYAISMFYGGNMLKNNEIEIGKVFKVAEAIILGTLMVGHLVFITPNITKAQIAAVKLLRIIESSTSIFINGDEKKLQGRVTFEDVSFQHPHYAGLPKLRRFSIDIQPGESVGLVGRPHSGVSIPLELILGFYSVTSGKITFDGERQTSFDTNNLRMQIGLVEGDPTFFQRTVADNISYGDLNRKIRLEEIVQVSRQALLHDFVVTLPRGYRTILDDGVNLTTSQKIRLSLARALIRRPKILLFLDLKRGESEDSEFILRAAIREASRERTCIASSTDPYSSVQLFPRLFVINKGAIEETGSHDELLNAKGLYAKLCLIYRNLN